MKESELLKNFYKKFVISDKTEMTTEKDVWIKVEGLRLEITKNNIGQGTLILDSTT